MPQGAAWWSPCRGSEGAGGRWGGSLSEGGGGGVQYEEGQGRGAVQAGEDFGVLSRCHGTMEGPAW